MKKGFVLALIALSLTACNSVTVSTRRMTIIEQDRFLYHGAYGDYILPKIQEPAHFHMAEKGDYGHGAGE